MREDKRKQNYVVYEIFPKSFKDSDGDGAGDIKGITSKLDYLEWLGIDYIWLTPINKSPLVDAGYDVSDYYDINEQFGSLDDFQELINEAKKRKIGIILDIVINHSSNEHEWFQKAINGDEEYQKYYYFMKGKSKGVPPNNWKSIFGGSAWKYIEKIDKWYLHIFDPAQPDLNWNYEKVRQEMADMTTFWIERGVAGFRVDAIIHIGKMDFEDATPESFAKAMNRSPEEFNIEKDPNATNYKYSNQPNFLPLFKDYKNRIKRRNEVLWIGESSSASHEVYNKLTNKKDDVLDLSCIFHHTGAHKQRGGKWWVNMSIDDEFFYNVFKEWQEYLDKNDLTICVNFCSHDHARIVSCYGDDKQYRLESSKALGGFIHLLRGIPFVYFAEELGIANHPFTSLDQLDDIRTMGDFNDFRKWMPDEEAVIGAIANSRDHARTPMPWENKDDLGWGSDKPWLPYDPANKVLSVEAQYYDKNSTLHFFRKLIQLRKDMKIIQDGHIKFERTHLERVYYYKRFLDNEEIHVYTSLSKNAQTFKTPIVEGEVLLNNYNKLDRNKIEPYQFVAIHVKK